MPDSRRTISSFAREAVLALGALAACAQQPVIEAGVIREEALREIVAGAVRARAIEPEGLVAARTVGRDELGPILREAFAEWKTPAEIADYERALVALGLWPADRDVLTEAIAAYGQHLVGIYVPSRRELLIVADETAGLESLLSSADRNFQLEFTLAHEIIHWLQHQAHPELMEPERLPKDSDDLEAAIQATLEGDAMRFGFEALGQPAPTAEQWAATFAKHYADPDGAGLEDAPALIRLTLGFPYTRGYALAWREGFELLGAPPISTEQVMHDERRREAFLHLDLGAIENRAPESCRILQRNTVGELQISVLFRDLLYDPDPSIWEGWNGDRYLAADCAGRVEWVWWTAWDSAADAEEFATAYREVAPAVGARADSALPIASRAGSIYVVVTSAGFSDEASYPPPASTRVSDLPTLRGLLGARDARANAQ